MMISRDSTPSASTSYTRDRDQIDKNKGRCSLAGQPPLTQKAFAGHADKPRTRVYTEIFYIREQIRVISIQIKFP